MTTLTIKIEGVGKVLRTLRSFDRKTQSRIIRASLRTSTNPIKKQMRKEIRREKAVDKKNLVKSIVTKLKTYSSGAVFLAVGARRKKLPDGANPANYIHLVGGGTQQHSKRKNPSKPWRVKTKRGWITLPNQIHPGSSPRPFRKNAARKTRQLVSKSFRERTEQLVRRELTKNV